MRKLKEGEFPAYKKTSISDLVPYANNSRTHTPAQIEKVARSIQEFGFINPVVIDSRSNMIVAGHARIEAAKRLGMESVPCIDVQHLSKRQAQAYVIADNRLAEDAGWDESMLIEEMRDLQIGAFDLTILGFSEKQMEAFGFGEVESAGMPSLGSGDRDPYQQRTFILHDEQAQVLDDALTLARTDPRIDTGINENSNGNAITWICEQWLQAQKQ